MVGSESAFDSRCGTVIRDKRSMDVCGDDSVDAGSIGEKCVLNEFRQALAFMIKKFSK